MLYAKNTFMSDENISALCVKAKEGSRIIKSQVISTIAIRDLNRSFKSNSGTRLPEQCLFKAPKVVGKTEPGRVFQALAAVGFRNEDTKVNIDSIMQSR